MHQSHRALWLMASCALALPATAFAGKDNRNYLNGKPFAALSAQITQNSASIAALEQETAGLHTRLDTITSDIERLGGEVEFNREAIESLVASLRDLSVQVAYNEAELNALRQQHAADIANLEAELAALDGRLAALRVAMASALNGLNSQLAELKTALETQSGSIDALLTNVASLMTEVMSLSVQLDSGEARLAALEQDVGELGTLLAEIDAAIQGLDDRITALESTQDNVARTVFSGIQSNVSASALKGWEVCHLDTYGVNANWESVVNAQCTKANLMLACRQTGSDTLILAAQGKREDVLFDTGTGNETHVANKVAWYYNDDHSWGFAEPGDGVRRNSCDTLQGEHPESRLCWHTKTYVRAGYRCGIHAGLNHSPDFERIVLQAD